MSTFIDKNYRYELKYEINFNYAQVLKYRLSLLMERDKNSKSRDNSYYIRSLYFDDVYDTAYYEKIDGLEKRKKYRIRFYNFDLSYIVLELKGKEGNLTYKEQNKITKDEYIYLINKEYDKINIDDRKVLEEFILESKLKNLVPSVIVDYTRIAYTYPIGDVRITFDFNISSGKFNYDLFDTNILMYDVLEKDTMILEVKYNDFMPKVIKDIIKMVPMTRISMSKFAMCKEKKGV